MADGNYHELQFKKTDFNRLLISPEKTSVGSHNRFCEVTEESNNRSDKPTITPRQGSIKSSSSSIDESEIKITKGEPIEEVETYFTGNVSKSVYLSYIFAGDNICQLSFLVLTTVLTCIVGSGGDYWISYWY